MYTPVVVATEWLWSVHSKLECTLCQGKGLPHAFDIGVFKYGKSNHAPIKHIYNESENLNGSCDVAFDSNCWWNLP